MRLSLAVIALISNVSAVNLTNEVAGQKSNKFMPLAGFINGQQQKSSKPSNRGDTGFFGAYSRSGAMQVSSDSNRMVNADDFEQEDSQPKNLIRQHHSHVQKADEDSLAEADAKQEELKANQAQSDATDQANAVDAANRAAAQAAATKKVYEESEFKRKFNAFDGLVHEDDGTSWNHGDGVQVRGVNKFLNIKNKSHKHHHRKMRQDEDSMQEKQAKEDEKAALNAELAAKEQAQKAAAAKAVWDRKHNNFDGLVHEDDGKKYGLDGKEVAGVNKFIKQKHHGKHHKKSHMREQNDIQIEGINDRTVTDKFLFSLNPEDKVLLKRQQKEAEVASHQSMAQALQQEQADIFNSRTLNAFDGLIHDKLGRKFDPNDGTQITTED